MLAFLLILLPLLVLAWQAWQSLNALSDQAAVTNRSTLIDARRSEAMTNVALEMERSYRQYCVLDDPTLAKGHCCKVSDEAAFCLIQRPYISKTLLTRRISPRGSP